MSDTMMSDWRMLLRAYASEQVHVVLDVWRNSPVPVDRASAIGLRRALQVEVIDYVQNVEGRSYDEAYRVAKSVAVGRRRHVSESDHRPELRAAVSWEFTPAGDDLDGEWERIDEEGPS